MTAAAASSVKPQASTETRKPRPAPGPGCPGVSGELPPGSCGERSTGSGCTDPAASPCPCLPPISGGCLSPEHPPPRALHAQFPPMCFPQAHLLKPAAPMKPGDVDAVLRAIQSSLKLLLNKTRTLLTSSFFRKIPPPKRALSYGEIQLLCSWDTAHS